MIRYIFIFLILSSSFACQQDTSNATNNDIKLFVDYYVRYLQNEQELKAEATFKRGLKLENATKIELEGEVSFDDKVLQAVKVNNAIYRYQLEEKTPFKTNNQFIIEHDAGHLTKHSIQMSPIGKFALENGVASKKKGFVLSWDGANLTKEERLLVLVTDINNKAHSIAVTGPSKNQKVEIKGIDLQPLAAGNGYIYLVKKRMQEEVQNGVCISSLTEFYTNRILIDIVE